MYQTQRIAQATKMKKRSIGCQCSCEAVCDECGGCVGLECVISDIAAWQCSKTTKVQSGLAECVGGDWRIPVGTADGSVVYRNSSGSVLPSGTALYITFDGSNCGRGWTSSWYGSRTNPNDFQTYTQRITGSFNCTTCSGAQTGVATQFFWEENGVAICTFTGIGCGGNPDTNVCDAPDDDCAATDQICEKISITSFAADNDHPTRVFEFDQVAGYKPHWYDSKRGLVPCTVVYTDSDTPANSYTRLGFSDVDGLDLSYSNTVKLFAGETQVFSDTGSDGKFTEAGNPCSGTHSGTEACEGALLGPLGDMSWSYTQASNECAPEVQNCCGTSLCGYTGITAFTMDDVDAFGFQSTYQWSMQSLIKTSPCEWTLTCDDISGNNGGTTIWFLRPDSFTTGEGRFTLEAQAGGNFNNSFINVTFTGCALVQSVNGGGDFGVACPIVATFLDNGSC